MRECLKCKKNIDDKNEAAKFCSTSCRVMYHRKYGKTKSVSEVQVQVLYNAMLDMVGKIQYATPTAGSYDGKRLTNIQDELPMFTKTNIPIKSFEYYRAAKKALDSEEDWMKMAAEIDAALNLTIKQKSILLTTNL